MKESARDWQLRWKWESWMPPGAAPISERREPVVLDRLEAPTLTNLAGAGLLYVDWYDGPRVVEAMETAFSQGVPVFLQFAHIRNTGAKRPRPSRRKSVQSTPAWVWNALTVGRTRSVRKPCRHRAFPDRSGRGLNSALVSRLAGATAIVVVRRRQGQFGETITGSDSRPGRQGVWTVTAGRSGTMSSAPASI